MLLVDVHAHLDHCKFKQDLDKVIENAKKNNVKTIINNGINPEKNRATLELAKKYDVIKAALGLYPTDAIKLKEEEIANELEFIKKNKDKIVAIGEIGLDYHWNLKQHDKQKEIFEKIINLAEKIKKPLIVHSRKAEEDVIDILESSKIKKVVLHCFSGSISLVNKAYDLGYYFSIPTNVVRSNHFQEIVKIININRIVTETDSPYLSPFSGQRNEPSNVLYSIKKIAEIKNMDAEEVANNIWMNYKNLFE